MLQGACWPTSIPPPLPSLSRATEEDIVTFFSQCGTVVDVVRRTNQQGAGGVARAMCHGVLGDCAQHLTARLLPSPAGRLNSFCHVQFDTVEGVERACQMEGPGAWVTHGCAAAAAADERRCFAGWPAHQCARPPA